MEKDKLRLTLPSPNLGEDFNKKKALQLFAALAGFFFLFSFYFTIIIFLDFRMQDLKTLSLEE